MTGLYTEGCVMTVVKRLFLFITKIRPLMFIAVIVGGQINGILWNGAETTISRDLSLTSFNG